MPKTGYILTHAVQGVRFSIPRQNLPLPCVSISETTTSTRPAWILASTSARHPPKETPKVPVQRALMSDISSSRRPARYALADEGLAVPGQETNIYRSTRGETQNCERRPPRIYSPTKMLWDHVDHWLSWAGKISCTFRRQPPIGDLVPRRVLCRQS